MSACVCMHVEYSCARSVGHPDCPSCPVDPRPPVPSPFPSPLFHPPDHASSLSLVPGRATAGRLPGGEEWQGKRSRLTRQKTPLSPRSRGYPSRAAPATGSAPPCPACCRSCLVFFLCAQRVIGGLFGGNMCAVCVILLLYDGDVGNADGDAGHRRRRRRCSTQVAAEFARRLACVGWCDRPRREGRPLIFASQTQTHDCYGGLVGRDSRRGCMRAAPTCVMVIPHGTATAR